MKVIKRDGHMVDWCPEKVEIAIEKANAEVEEEDQASANTRASSDIATPYKFA
jgi:anaerobic ribonucleoside-triphosphate reductase